MEKIAFRMQLKPGCADEYRRRHDAIGPELVELLRGIGIRDYSIHLDPETHALFAVLWRDADHRMDELSQHPLIRRWWAHMADLMQMHADGAPITIALQTMFHMA